MPRALGFVWGRTRASSPIVAPPGALASAKHRDGMQHYDRPSISDTMTPRRAAYLKRSIEEYKKKTLAQPSQSTSNVRRASPRLAHSDPLPRRRELRTRALSEDCSASKCCAPPLSERGAVRPRALSAAHAWTSFAGTATTSPSVTSISQATVGYSGHRPSWRLQAAPKPIARGWQPPHRSNSDERKPSLEAQARKALAHLSVHLAPADRGDERKTAIRV